MANWHHAPAHTPTEAATYCITAATYEKRLIFRTRRRLDLLQDAFFDLAAKYRWLPQAWAFFPNHYHLVVANDGQISKVINELHSMTARKINEADGEAGRRVWFQYWDTQITSQGSYLARLHYVHHNAVHHRVVREAEQYQWCSAAWFARMADPAFHRTVSAMKIDRVTIRDDFQ